MRVSCFGVLTMISVLLGGCLATGEPAEVSGAGLETESAETCDVQVGQDPVLASLLDSVRDLLGEIYESTRWVAAEATDAAIVAIACNEYYNPRSQRQSVRYIICARVAPRIARERITHACEVLRAFLDDLLAEQAEQPAPAPADPCGDASCDDDEYWSGVCAQDCQSLWSCGDDICDELEWSDGSCWNDC